MKSFNSISFGAMLNNVGINAVNTAKLTAGLYDTVYKTQAYTKALKSSLNIIRGYEPNKRINISYEDKYGYDNDGGMHQRHHKAKLDNKVIYEEVGDEMEFFINFANAIKNNHLISRPLSQREIDEGEGVNFIPKCFK